MKRVSWIVVSVLALAACSSSPPPEVNPYAAEVRHAQQHATSDFEKEVLSDGIVTEAEYDEAVHRQVDCAESKGANFKAIKGRSGLYTYEVRGDSQSSADRGGKIMDECAIGNTSVIVGLYNDMTANPRKEDRYDLVLACLKRFKIVDQSYTRDQLLTDEHDPEGGKKLAGEIPVACFNNPMIEP